jgi:hypothetical protein
MNNTFDKNLLLNKIKELSIQKNIINNFDTVVKKEPNTNNEISLESIKIPSGISIIIPQNVMKQNEDKIEIKEDKIDIEIIKEDKIEHIEHENELSNKIINSKGNSSIITNLNDLYEDKETLDINKILNIIKSLKEPISILENYLKYNNIPIDIDKEQVKDYINIYNSVSNISKIEDITKITTQIEKTGCFKNIKALFIKNVEEKTGNKNSGCLGFIFNKKTNNSI